MAPPGQKEREIWAKFNKTSKENNKGPWPVCKKCGDGLQGIKNRMKNHAKKCYPEDYQQLSTVAPVAVPSLTNVLQEIQPVPAKARKFLRIWWIPDILIRSSPKTKREKHWTLQQTAKPSGS